MYIYIYNHVEVDTIWDVRTYSRVSRDRFDILLQDSYISNMIYLYIFHCDKVRVSI